MNYKNNHDDDDSVSSSFPCSGRDDNGGMTSELGARDVLLGRGTGPNEHIGNVRYRALLGHKATEDGGTMNYASLSSTKKRDFAKEVVASVKAMGGRFMKHAPHNNSGAGGGTNMRYYVEVPDNVAINKVKQGFRHQIKANRFPNKGQGPPPAGSTPALIMDTRSKKSLPDDQKKLLPIRGEESDFLTSCSKVETKVCRPDFNVEDEMLAPLTFDYARALTTTTLKFPRGGGSAMNTLGGHLDQLYHGLPRSTMWLSHHRWLALFSTVVTATRPAPFLRRSPSILPPQHPFLLRFSPFTCGIGNTPDFEWDPCVLDLIALRLERPNNDMVLHRAPVIR